MDFLIGFTVCYVYAAITDALWDREKNGTLGGLDVVLAILWPVTGFGLALTVTYEMACAAFKVLGGRR